MSQMDSTVVNVSLSAIRDDLHSTTESAQWVVSAYLLALAPMLPLNGWLVDRLGAKRLYLTCFTLFTVSSMGCGVARSMGTLASHHPETPCFGLRLLDSPSLSSPQRGDDLADGAAVGARAPPGARSSPSVRLDE